MTAPQMISSDQVHEAIARRLGRPHVQLVAAVSSRLGRDPRLHGQVCRFVSRSLLDSRGRAAVALVALGSAIEPWLLRGAELFGVPVVRIAVGRTDPNADLCVHLRGSDPPSRDAVVIQAADRVDAVYVRAGGEIERGLRQRIALRKDGTTRVAIIHERPSAAGDLIARGAVGWYLLRRPPAPGPRLDTAVGTTAGTPANDGRWIQTSGAWLVHCTRGSATPWPGETIRQYRDAILLGSARAAERQPIDALVRILRGRRLIAASATTADPVVCFSELPLIQLLSRRCYRPHLGRWDYEPYGVAIRRQAAEQAGIRRVVYGPAPQRSSLAPDERFRFQAEGTTYDWRQEQEWRAKGHVALDQFAPQDLRVFAADREESRQKLADSPWPVTFLSENPSASI